VDCITLEPLRPGRVFRHVAEDGREQPFDADALAEFFLRSARFLNPLTGEELRRREVCALARRLPVARERALRATYLLREDLLRWQLTRGDEAFEDTEQCDELLEQLLELGGYLLREPPRFAALLAAYHLSLESLGDLHGAAALERTLELHRARVRQRPLQQELTRALATVHWSRGAPAGAEEPRLLEAYFSHLLEAQ